MMQAKVKSGRTGKRRRARRQPVLCVTDATPERLAKCEADASEFVNPAEIDSSEQLIGRTRRFRDSWIDSLYRRGHLTYAQWYACGWYRDLHAMAFTPQRVVAKYGNGSGGGGSANYGQAHSEAQQIKRELFRSARDHVPTNMLALVEGVVLRDSMPPFANGRQRERFAARFAAAVQPLASYLGVPGWWLAEAVDEVSVSV